MLEVEVNVGDDVEVVGIVDDIAALIVVGVETELFKPLCPTL